MNTVLIDATNFDEHAPALIEKIKAAQLVGLDTETQDDARHEGLNKYCGYDPITRKKSKGKKLVFDFNRMTMTGFSLFPDGSDFSFYVNLNHADVANRLPWEKARLLLDAKPAGTPWVAHNAPFELTVFRKIYDFALPNILCTLQQCVSAYGPDEYSTEAFIVAGLGGMKVLIPQMVKASRGYSGDRYAMNAELSEVFNQITGKESDADWSYNGFVGSINWGYDLKKVIKHRFGVKMRTFEDTLNGKAHMGQLTGEETAAYGGDDAYWAIRLYHDNLRYMMETNPASISAFFEQENPMVHIYSDIWCEGLKVNKANITKRRAEERVNAAATLRKLRATVRALLPFPAVPNAKLAEYDDWYAKGFTKYRQRVAQWALTGDSADDFTQCAQISGAVSNAWATDMGKPKPTGPNFTHYMMMRTLMYDLLNQQPIILKGKVQSDGEGRGQLVDRLTDAVAKEMMACITELAGIEQRMKLYLTPYEQLTDPETSRMYPSVTSKLASRRMGCAVPNGMQLAKRGQSTYVRGFYEADEDDQVVVSIDWSGIELVEIGEFSKDPAFFEAYGQLPHKDLHARAAASALRLAMVPKLTTELFKQMPLMTVEMVNDLIGPAMLIDLNKVAMEPKKAYSYWRTEVGKVANFNYWYSGALSTVGDKLGWTSEEMWAATEGYREEFAVAEAWRKQTIQDAQSTGYVQLPDGHRRVRYEATPFWRQYFESKFAMINEPGFRLLIKSICQNIQGRANNQIVNSLIQGTCATIAKRSILRIALACQELEWDKRIARFMLPIHDELLFSVSRRYVVPFIEMAKMIMCDHPDIFPTLKLDASAAVGINFEPWNEKKAPLGQIELNEAPALPVFHDARWGKRLTHDEIDVVIDYLMMKKAA